MAARFRITGVINADFIYVNSTAVGSGAENKKIDDIQLVQVFLHEFFRTREALFKKVAKPSRGAAKQILIDGTVGPQTVSAIGVFQTQVKQSTGKGFVDGRVSVPATGPVIPGTTGVFTIIVLNATFFSAPENKAFNENLEDHPLLKSSPHLIAELKRRKAVA